MLSHRVRGRDVLSNISKVIYLGKEEANSTSITQKGKGKSTSTHKKK